MVDATLMTHDHKPRLTATELAALALARNEAGDLVQRRQASLAAYDAMTLPDRVTHLWRYTDPRDLLPRELDLNEPPVIRSGAWEVPEQGPSLVMTTGAAPRLNTAATRCGVVVLPLAAAGDDLARLGSAVPERHGICEALNGAAWNAGVLVKLPRGLELDDPLHVLVPAAERHHLPRLLIVAEAGARGTVVQEHVGGDAETRVVGVTEVLVDSAAQLHHVLVQKWNRDVHAHLTSRGRIERDGKLFTILASFGGRLVKLDLGAELVGVGAQSELAGVTLTEGRQHVDHHTEHRHLAPHTWSNLDFRVALAGRSRSAYTGLIRIEEDAPHSEAFQENRNLLLSERCRADTIPELEILTDEVACSHGATAAPVDPEQLFYLASRGIPGGEALQLVVRGFLAETLSRVPEKLRGGIEDLVDARLARLRGVAP